MDFPRASYPDDVELAASADRNPATVFGKLAKRTGFSVDILARAARDGRLNRYIAKPGEIAARRRTAIDALRFHGVAERRRQLDVLRNHPGEG